ncbi:MAG: dockerin type I repeat-containing protein [Oscillospiraceae bacterium]|nr:dockerin type I repeat-containing protein [Oscillospiraceae bacterium]
MKKLRKRNIAALSAAFALCVTACPVCAGNVCAEEAESGAVTDIDVSKLPEWVPNDFLSSLEFVKEHGTTLVKDNLICIVKKRSGRLYDDYTFSTEISENYSDDIVFSEIFDFDIPQTADKSDRDAYEEYMLYLNNLGIDEYLLAEYQPDVSYEVIVFAPSCAGNLDIGLVKYYKNGEEAERKDLSFEITENGITETDLFAWLPDCRKEFNELFDEYLKCYTYENYVVFCGTPFHCAGYSWKNSQNGTSRMKCISDTRITEEDVYPLPPGSEPHEILVYAPAGEGTVEMTWGEYQKSVDDSYRQMDKGFFSIDKNGNITEILQENMIYPLYGDCNNDGKTSVADILMLQKWFLGKGKLTSPVNADYNMDGKVNIFDFTELKGLLTQR